MSTEHAAAATQHGDSHAGHGKRPYMAIFWSLLVLTIIEVSTLWMPESWGIPHWMLGCFLMALAFGKASLVAAYYMHLRYDPLGLTGIFLAPFGLALFFAVMMVFQLFF